MKHLMLDLETLGVKPSAVVLSIGAVVFDPYSPTISASFYVELTNHLDKQLQAGRTVSGSTITWWMRQSPEAQRVFDYRTDGDDRYDPQTAVGMFAEFCGVNCVEFIWAKDPDFDIVILRSLFDDFSRGYMFPFNYSKSRSVRTMEAMPFAHITGNEKPVAHNALADATAQAVRIQEIFACLNSQSSA